MKNAVTVAPVATLSFEFCILNPSSISRIRVGLEKDFDVARRIDESIKALVRIGQERAARNDQHPIRVPDRLELQRAILAREQALPESAKPNAAVSAFNDRGDIVDRQAVAGADGTDLLP